MDKDYLAKRLIYLTGRSDPKRINTIFESILLELDRYITDNIPYVKLSDDRAIRNWIAHSNKETVQLIKLWLQYKENNGIRILKDQNEIIEFLPDSYKAFWLYECLIKKEVPSVNRILKELREYPELIIILVLVHHKTSYRRLKDLIGNVANTLALSPKKGASSLKYFLKHAYKGSFTLKEFLKIKPELAREILYLYSPMNNRWKQELKKTNKLIRKDILYKYESNRKYWHFTPEKHYELVLINEAAVNFSKLKFSSADLKKIVSFKRLDEFKIQYVKHLKVNDKLRFEKHTPSYEDNVSLLSKSNSQEAVDYLVPIVCRKKEIYEHINSISWHRGKLILTSIIDAEFNCIYYCGEPVFNYFNECKNDRKIQFIKWLHKYKYEYYKMSMLSLLDKANKKDSQIIYKYSDKYTLIDCINSREYDFSGIFIANNKDFIFRILDKDYETALKRIPNLDERIVRQYLDQLNVTDSTISKYIYINQFLKSECKYEFLDKQTSSIDCLLRFIKKTKVNISEENYWLMLNKIIEKKKIIPRNIIFDKNNSINRQFKRSFIELLKNDNNLTYFEKYNFIGANFINQFYIDSPFKFWNDILLNEQITTSVKDCIYNIITTKSFSRSLIINPSVSKYFDDQTTLNKCNKYIKRRQIFEGKPGLEGIYELCFYTNIHNLPLYLNILRKIKYTHLKEFSGSQFDDLYHTYKLPKKSGGNRIITVPNSYLKSIQKSIYESILKTIPLHKAAKGFREGYSIVDNARIHVGKNIVMNTDIANFFPNTSNDLVWKALYKHLKSRFSKNCIRLISELCCYKRGLPIGAPTSPVISNLVLKPCDTAFSKISKKLNIEYSRYADDLTFSGDENIINILPFVKDVLGKKGFQLDPKKTNIFRKGRRQCVTGLVVNEQISVARPIRKRIRASVHNACQQKPIFWQEKPMNINELMGRIAFLNLVHPLEAAMYKKQLKNKKLI